jgi:hypothetical protein
MRAQEGRINLCLGVLVIAIGSPWLVQIGAAEQSSDQPANLSQEPNDLRCDLAQRFQAEWASTELSAKVTIDQDQGWQPAVSPRAIIVSGKIRILDSDNLVAIDANPPKLLTVGDQDGNDLRLLPSSAASCRSYRKEDFFYCDASLGSHVRGPKPYDLVVRLDLDPNQPVPSSLSALQGYIYVLYTPNVIEIDVPFQASEEWFEFGNAPDLRVCVVRAEPQCCTSQYHTGLTTTAVSLRGVGDCLMADDRIAHYIVLDVQLFTLFQGVSSISIPMSSLIRGQFVQTNTLSYYAVDCLGEGRLGYTTIRHIIAVDPVEVKIPFVLKDIPVPSMGTAGK